MVGVVPFVDRSLDALLSPCFHVEDCCGVKLNWRTTKGYRTWPDHNLPMWKSPVAFDIGAPNHHVKSFVRVAPLMRYRHMDPHTIQTRGGNPNMTYFYWRDDMQKETKGPPPKSSSPSFQTPAPAETQRAVVLHTQCSTLFQWIAKKTLMGRADLKISSLREGCPTCNSSEFLPLVREYESVCGNFTSHAGQTAIGLYGDSRELRILSFLDEHSANLSALVAPPSGLLHALRASVELALAGLG